MPSAIAKPPANGQPRAAAAPAPAARSTRAAASVSHLADALTGVGDAPPATSGRRPQRLRVSRQEVADMTAQMAIMIKSGVDLSSALASLTVQCERPALAYILEEVNRLVIGGNTLSESLRQFPDVFDPAYTATIAAAEASGRMADVLRQLADMQRNELRLRRSITSMLTYPVLLTVISSGVIATLVVVVLPRFAEIFEQYGAELPVTTQMLISVATEFRSRWWLWIPLAVASVVGAFVWRSTEHGRRSIDGFLIKFPQVRNVTRPMLVGRLCRMLALLLQSGVPLLDGLRLSREAISNYWYKELLGELTDAVVNGQGMAATLLHADVIPPSAREMIATAERTGNLAEVTQLLGGYYEEEAENRMKQLVRILEPVITVVMGAVVAFVVLSVMLPIFDLSSMTSGEGPAGPGQ